MITHNFHAARYTLYAHDVPVWCYNQEPTQEEIDRAAQRARMVHGWAGPSLALYTPAGFLCTVDVSAPEDDK